MAEFKKELVKLREGKNLTQEELAKQLEVRYSAIKDWESGHGTPDFEDLQNIADYFEIEVKDLVNTEEVILFAEKELTWNANKYSTMILCLLDCMLAILLFLPIYVQTISGVTSSVVLTELVGISNLLRICFVVVVLLTILNGFVGLTMLRMHNLVWLRHRVITGFAFSVVSVIMFMTAGQQYAGIVCLVALLLKGLLLPRH